jgi:hypothetical protein
MKASVWKMGAVRKVYGLIGQSGHARLYLCVTPRGTYFLFRCVTRVSSTFNRRPARTGVALVCASVYLQCVLVTVSKLMQFVVQG